MTHASVEAPVRPLPPLAAPLWSVLFLFRAIGELAGLDRLPLLPSLPGEVLINDPALALSQGRGLVGPSFEHSVNGLDRMYAHFPPVFIFLQSLVYRAFGLSAFSLRAPGVLAGLAGFGLFLLVLREFYGLRIIDRFGLVVGSALLMLEPTSLIQFRQSRMESTNVLFGALAFWLAVRATHSARAGMPLWIASSVAAGFALATHPSAMLFVPPLAGWSLLHLRRFNGHHGWVTWFAVNALPLAVFGVIMLIAYGPRAVDALAEMQHLSHYNPAPSFSGLVLVRIIFRAAFGELQQAGGFATAIMAIAPVLAGARYFVVRESGIEPPHPDWWCFLAAAAGVVLVQCLLVAWVLPWSGPNRVVMSAPFAILCCAVALSHLPISLSRLAVAGAALALLAEAGICAGYLAQLKGGAEERGPARFDSIVDDIPHEAHVAASPEFWFAFRRRGRSVALLYRGLDEPRYWRETAGALDPYDVVILDPTAEDYESLLAKARATKPIERVLHTWRRDFTLLQRPMPESARLN